MSRLIPYAGSNAARRTPAGAATASPPLPSAQDRLEAVAKYIPGEILAFFLPATSAVEMLAEGERRLAHWAVFGLSWALVPVYFRWVAHGDPRSTRQMAISTLAFPIWAYATNRTVGALGPWFLEARALLLLLGFTLLTAFLVPRRP